MLLVNQEVTNRDKRLVINAVELQLQSDILVKNLRIIQHSKIITSMVVKIYLAYS